MASSRAGTPARTCRGVHTCPLCRGAGGSAVGSSPGQYPVSSAYSIRASAVVSAATGSCAAAPRTCLLSAAAQGRVQAEAGDLEAAARVPAHRMRGQPQVRPAGPVRDRDSVGRVRDHRGGQGRLRQRGRERPGQHQVLQVRAGRPLGHDVRALLVEVGVVDGGQPRVGYLGGGLHRVGHGPRDGSRGQQVDRDGTAEQLVGGLPQRKAARLPRGAARRKPADLIVQAYPLV